MARRMLGVRKDRPHGHNKRKTSEWCLTKALVCLCRSPQQPCSAGARTTMRTSATRCRCASAPSASFIRQQPNPNRTYSPTLSLAVNACRLLLMPQSMALCEVNTREHHSHKAWQTPRSCLEPEPVLPTGRHEPEPGPAGRRHWVWRRAGPGIRRGPGHWLWRPNH